MPTDLELRPAHADDAEALTDLFLAAREAAYPQMPRPVHSPASVRDWFGQLLGERPRTLSMPERRETWVADRDGRVAGFLVLDPGWLDSLYVRPDLTGEGIGSALLDLAKSLRPAGFGLWVFETNLRAREFYRRHGLVVVRRTDGSENEERSPDLELAWLGASPTDYVRRRIDDVDTRLASLLAERAALTALVQDHKPVRGHAGRDPAREAEIVTRMAGVAGRLGHERLARIMEVVIGESLDAAEAERAAGQRPGEAPGQPPGQRS